MAKTEANKVERKPYEIKPKDVQVEAAFHSYKTVSIRLPEDFNIDDLNARPEIFKLVQADRTKALAEYDRLELRGFDWTVYATVNHADSERVILFDIKRASKPKRELALYDDGHYQVRWTQDGGYSYFRKSDSIKMSGAVWPTPEAAKAALIREQYASKVA